MFCLVQRMQFTNPIIGSGARGLEPYVKEWSYLNNVHHHVHEQPIIEKKFTEYLIQGKYTPTKIQGKPSKFQ